MKESKRKLLEEKITRAKRDYVRLLMKVDDQEIRLKQLHHDLAFGVHGLRVGTEFIVNTGYKGERYAKIVGFGDYWIRPDEDGSVKYSNAWYKIRGANKKWNKTSYRLYGSCIERDLVRIVKH